MENTRIKGLTILKNGQLLTMNDGSVLKDADLWIENGKIVKISDRKETIPENADVIDVSGCVVMPGMIDSHVHYDESYMGDFFLASGVTSVRNMQGFAGHAKWRDKILAGTRRGPYIYSSGPIADGEDPTIPDNTNIIIRSKADAENIIAYTKKYGFLWLKTYPSMEPKLYKYLLRRAAEEGLPPCGHMTKILDYKSLIDAGYSCCEHTSSLPREKEDIVYAAQHGMWFCPTHVVCKTLPDYVWNGKQLTEVEHFEDLPECIRKRWEEENEITCENYRKLGIKPDFQTIIDRGRTFLEYSDRVMAGTDCPYAGVVPGFAMADELESLVDAYGMTRYAALAAATSRPAEYIGISDQKGKLLPGLDSDLIVLEENPLEAVGAVRKIRMVFQGENVWDKEVLDGFLKAAGRLTQEEIEFIPLKI